MFARNRKKYLGGWAVAILIVWAVLLTIRADSPWVDLIIFGEVSVAAVGVVVLMFRYTDDWTVRGLGIFGLMLTISLLYGPQLGQHLRFWGPPPPANIPTYLPAEFVQFRRSIIAVSAPCLLYGFVVWYRENIGRL